ncbi:MAG: ATP-binding cassette domain-containing protein [Bacteroidales bacterium]|nr:ATP-binding cassette domain-containing protein [Candidatus Cacconaster merdequi]
MLNDTLLSGLINLFALLGAKSGVDVSKSLDLLNSYLCHHFGLRNPKVYTDLYTDLRALYDDGDLIDKDSVVDQICSKIRSRISQEELALTLLRLMEFCHVEPELFNGDDPVFKQIASHFSVTDELLGDFVSFVLGNENDNVRHQVFGGYDGCIKTLWIGGNNTLVFTYEGKDEVLFDDMPLVPGVFQIWHKSGVVKNRKGAPLYYSSVHRPYDSDTVESVVYCGRDVNFRFPGTDIGMHDFSFTIKSGELVAIMGGSGTGKTTLLSLLNGTIAPQSGTLTINGHPISEQSARGMIGFVPQDDLLIEELTVYQNLYYTARLCFDGMSEEQLHDRVMAVLRDLCLDHASDLVVGSPLNKTISGGQRKRLNIALELIREPAVLFLDEPTSGLSSADTENVLGLLKDQTNKGKLVVVNIHQPSSDVYKLFDRLWLLDKGGYPVFDGNPIEAVTYFKRAANYADSDASTCPVCGNVNPEIVLNIIDEKALDSSGRPSTERKTSPQQWHEMYLSDRSDKEKEEPKVSGIPDSGQKKPGAFKQFLIFLERNIKSKLTNRQYLLITLLEAPVLALICGLLTHYAPLSGYTVMENKNLVSYFFMAVIVATFLGMSGSAEEIIRDRTLLKRERFLNLSYGSYIWSKIVYSAMVSLVQTALFIVVGNLVMGLHGMFLMWWMILFVSSLLSNLIGLLMSQCLSSVVSIYISIPILLIPQILLCGLVVPFSDLNGDSTTDNVPLIGDVIPSRWAFEAIAVGSFCYNDYEKDFFDIDRERGEAFFFHEAYIYELESQMETMADEMARGIDASSRVDILRTNLPRLENVCGIRYDGDFSYESLSQYLSEAKSVLSSIGNKLTLRKDKILTKMIDERGSAEIVSIKKRSYNLQLENFVTGAGSGSQIDLVNGHFVPRVGTIYLTPVSRNGRAPFYSSVKVLGNTKIPTLWFDTCILLLMCLLLTLVLLANIPERLRKQY